MIGERTITASGLVGRDAWLAAQLDHEIRVVPGPPEERMGGERAAAEATSPNAHSPQEPQSTVLGSSPVRPRVKASSGAVSQISRSERRGASPPSTSLPPT